MKSRLTRNISFKMLAEGLARVLSLIFFLAVTRLLGDQGYGRYAFVVAFGSLFSAVLMDWGTNTFMIREISLQRQQLQRFVPNILAFKLTLSLGTWLAAMAAIVWLGYPAETVAMVGWGALIAVCMSWLETLNAFFNAIERLDQEVWLKTSQRSLILLLTLAILWQQPAVLPLLQGVALAYLASVLLGLVLLRRLTGPVEQSSLPFLQDILRRSLAFWLTGIFALAYFKTDTVMLSLFGRSDAEIGWYNAVIKLMDVLGMFPQLIVLGMYPVLTDLYARSPADFCALTQKTWRVLLKYGLPLATGGSLVAEPMLADILGPAFYPAAAVFCIMVWALVFMFMNVLFFYTLAAMHQQRIAVWLTGGAFGLNIGLNALLIPHWGYLGTGLSTVVVQGLLWGAYLGSLKYLLVNFRWPEGLLGIAVGNAALAGLVWYLLQAGLAWYVTVPLAAAAYGLGMKLPEFLTGPGPGR